MDPITLFALANGAVSAVKAGCKLYKDIKGAAGDIHDVLKDLDNQFNSKYKDKPPTVEAKNQYIKEKNRIIELNKKGGEIDDIYVQIGNHLGEYYDNLHKCMAIFDEEEKRSKTEIYTGDDSLGKRALQRVLMKKKLEQMGTDLRQIMIYESPPELGALWTETNEMMEKLGKEQKVLYTRKIRAEEAAKKRKEARNKKLTQDAIIGFMLLIAIFCVGGMFMWVAHDRSVKYPQYGTGFFPRTAEERQRDSEPQLYIGR